MNIAVFSDDPSLKAAAEAWAKQLGLPLALTQQDGFDYFLVVTQDYIGLQKAGTVSPLYVDFLTGKNNYRAQNTSLKNEALAKAMGLKGRSHPKIIDATGGLAKDAFTLASLGFEVTLLERSPIIYTIVADAIQRAQRDPRVSPIVQRMHYVQTNAITWLQELEDPVDIIYLDPMFPERKKSALPKQEMLIIHDIVGEDGDAECLLKAALACTPKRVVVKRPRLAERLTVSPVPSFSLQGSSSRFDVYLC